MSKVEDVAKAIGRALPGFENQDATLACGPAREIGTPFWKHYEEAAVAAIEAMREPTDKMLAAEMSGEKLKWLPIATAPKECGKMEFVLLWLEEFNTPSVGAWSDDDQKWITPDDYFDLIGTPTHWMPLPEPPQ
jgi:hypothetical protein